MNCHKVQSLISAYVDSEMSGLEMLAIRQHLSDCSECRSEFEALHSIKKALGRMSPKQPSPDLAARICRQFDHVAETPKTSIFAELRKQLTLVPTGMRMAAAGVGAIAVLFMLADGGPVNYAQMPLAPAMSMSASNMRLSTIPASMETAALGSTPVPDTANKGWGLSNSGLIKNGSNGSEGFVLTGGIQ